MRILFLLMVVLVTFLSCSKKIYGTYNTSYSEDKNAFFQIKLNVDNTVEKTEIHTIRDFAKGKFSVTSDKRVVCFFDSSSSRFPPDTITFKLKGNKLYILRNGVLNKKAFLIRQQI